MFDTLKSRIFQGNQFIKDIKNAPMREQFRGFPILSENYECDEKICPTGALKTNPLSIDMGKCTFCGACERASNAVKFTNGYKLTSSDRNKLIITPDITYEEYLKSAVKIKKEQPLNHRIGIHFITCTPPPPRTAFPSLSLSLPP